MARLNPHHEQLDDNGVGKCSVPMWSGGCPAGFCDEPAYGKQEPDQRRYGGWVSGWHKWFPGYCSGLACYAHGGPRRKEEEDTPRMFDLEHLEKQTKMWAYVAEMHASVATIKAMEMANEECIMRGESLAYPEATFREIVGEFRYFAKCLRGL
jgi:hypothetical protein